MKIIIAHNRYRFRGGEDEVVDRETALLRSHGFEVHLLEADSRKLESQGLISQANAAWQLPYSQAARRRLQEDIKHFRPDVVHIHNFFPSLTPSLYDACLEQDIPVVQTLHNFRIFCAASVLARDGHPCELCLKGSTAPALRHRCYQGSWLRTFALTRMIRKHRQEDTWNQKVTTILVPSEFAKQKLEEGGIQPGKIVVKPNFVPEVHAIASALPTSPETNRYALYVGRLSQEKGIHSLLDAWDPSLPLLVLVGDGPLRAKVDEKAAASKNIQVIGRQSPEQVRALMEKALFLTTPSVCFETFGLAAAEAFSVGLPVIAAHIGALPEIVQDGHNGLLVPAGETMALRKAANRLTVDKALRQQLSTGALQSYRERYTPYRNYQMLCEIYKKAMCT